jgi:hypothetical protein
VYTLWIRTCFFASESSSNAPVLLRTRSLFGCLMARFFVVVAITLVETWLPYVEKCHVMFCLNAGRG